MHFMLMLMLHILYMDFMFMLHMLYMHFTLHASYALYILLICFIDNRAD